MTSPSKPPPKSSPTKSANFPRRDADGRIATLPDMVSGVLFYMVVGTILLVAIDGLVSLGVGTFGHISGWLAGVLLVFMFVEDFRGWKGAPLRIAVAFVGAVLGVVAGSALSAQIDSLPAVFAGAISVTVAGLIYAVVWFFGIRFVVSRLGER